MSKALKPGILCFLVGPYVWPFNRNKIVKLVSLRPHPDPRKHGRLMWSCIGMQPLQVGQSGKIKAGGEIGYARPDSLRPIDPDGTVTTEEVNELYLPTKEEISA